ncbi:unnamed protein product [Didymodactylos carnosus]|uniref:LysM domain-containing protein n=1 Tax=Didymodactylos carnosus TaxID=1234261 RepID=A0A814XFJ5_9BILA|nr:unnamed protein product [Didymodactylos carnosus]CAF1536346.1 unnamed protein product [Didymodactylos carnosus]CAF3980863.1 unnamed protein product [Didymodactylos carnosus]CAF4324049.1 unnamed protein product [Didymodactylos carnosus]
MIIFILLLLPLLFSVVFVWIIPTVSICGKLYVVKNGDSCWSIGKANSITVQQIQALNPQVGSNCSVPIGQSLLLQPPCTPQCGAVYTVKEGDSCWTISQNNSLTIAQIQALNPQLTSNCTVFIGQILFLQPACNSGGSTSTAMTTI